MKEPSYIRFDWAMKRMLRDKANYAVLEGLITTLLGRKIVIQKLLESESNQEDEYDKYNRVDILAEEEDGTLILIEVQNNNEYAYFQRMLFGVSKLVTEYIQRGRGYEHIRKIYSVNIVYFRLGAGTDTVYHGKTEFRGLHHPDEILRLTPFQQQKFNVEEVSQLYPEYYILRVNEFNKWSKVPLEQWIYFLNTGEIPDDATAPGLREAREHLRLARLSKDELASYYHHLDSLVILKDNVNTPYLEGKFEGRAEGMAEGIVKGRAEGKAEGMIEGEAKGRNEALEETARKLLSEGIPAETVAKCTGIALEEVRRISGLQ